MAKTVILLILSHLFAGLVGIKVAQWRLAKMIATLMRDTELFDELGIK